MLSTNLACNSAKIFTNFKTFFPDSLSNKPFLIWLLTMPPHLKYPSYTTLQFDVNQLFSDAVGWAAGRASGL